MRNLGIATLGSILAAAGSAWAGESGTATIAQTGTSPNAYTITLQNTGTENIVTFWYAWTQIPFNDFLKSVPTVTGTPSGFIDIPEDQDEGPNDGFSVFWYSLAGGIAPGSSATFSFTSADSLATLTGPSFFYPSQNTGTSILYNGIESGDSDQIVVTAAPEPASIGLLGMVGAMVLKRNRRNK
jgi:hypothetical protein